MMFLVKMLKVWLFMSMHRPVYYYYYYYLDNQTGAAVTSKTFK